MNHKIIKAKNIVVVLIIMSVLGCRNSQMNKKAPSVLVDTTRTVVTDNSDANKKENSSEDKDNDIGIKETEISIKNKSDYSDKFIEGLKKMREEKITLSDNLLILSDGDTIYFRETPEIGRRITLTGKKGNLVIVVTIKRFNYTTIDYKIEMTEFGKLNHTQSGKADIASGFYFGDESDTIDKTGISYFSTEFTDLRENDCYTYIRLGYEKETGPYLLGKIVKNCNGKLSDIDLDNFPTLIEK
ncbi:hypothetical protein ATE84_2140 [Aquimarina sp. MAR_2010_214]|uniref:hypothetical protein n=1 Tax=Aquimarina sp. MAR_2010_214 TaxID=1250026 RepID=UPI000CAAC6BD|nr:hypothetical protein [Aquimarina sp. MAR_2010_214]PKV50091.1 hypothetical protein ATE84_2140 [Aquimarina sp. MAR_2010_214]